MAKLGYIPCIAIALTVLAGCGEKVELAFPSGSPMKIASSDGEEWIPESDVRYSAFARWLDSNESGWSPIYHTPLGCGTSVSTDILHFQFCDRAVYYWSDGGVLTKSVQYSSLEFLNGTTPN